MQHSQAISKQEKTNKEYQLNCQEKIGIREVWISIN